MADNTKRPQNFCAKCRNSWFPKGKDISLKCPNCGSAETELVNNFSPVVNTPDRAGNGFKWFLVLGLVFIAAAFVAINNKSKTNAPDDKIVMGQPGKAGAPDGKIVTDQPDKIVIPNDKTVIAQPQLQPEDVLTIQTQKAANDSTAKELPEKNEVIKLQENILATKAQIVEMNKAMGVFTKSVADGTEPFKGERYYSRIKNKNAVKKISDAMPSLRKMPNSDDILSPIEADLKKAQIVLLENKE